jgi:hypothetical protein
MQSETSVRAVMVGSCQTAAGASGPLPDQHQRKANTGLRAAFDCSRPKSAIKLDNPAILEAEVLHHPFAATWRNSGNPGASAGSPKLDVASRGACWPKWTLWVRCQGDHPDQPRRCSAGRVWRAMCLMTVLARNGHRRHHSNPCAAEVRYANDRFRSTIHPVGQRGRLGRRHARAVRIRPVLAQHSPIN